MLRRRRVVQGEHNEQTSLVSSLQKDDVEDKKSKFPPPQPMPKPSYAPLVFLACVLTRIISAAVSPIADCDEVFNYWEPLHYLLFNFGFQTWEYSPDFALRSYLFLYPYAFFAHATRVIHNVVTIVFPAIVLPSPKIALFYSIRIAQAIVCAIAETSLYSATHRKLGRNIAIFFVIFTLSSPGMFRSSVEFLPSSFAQIALMAAFASWMDDYLHHAVFFVALASLLGWVFSAVLGAPLALYIIVQQPAGLLKLLRYGTVSAFVIAGLMVLVDSWHYGKFVLAPLNHIVYNVFPQPGAGSELYGVEPWTFYLHNLLLNCTVSFVIFALYPLLLAVMVLTQKWTGMSIASRERSDRVWLLSAPFAALAIFLAQPHKEERFLAPCYPLIALVAATGLADGARLLHGVSVNGSSLSGRMLRLVATCVVGGVVIVSCMAGSSRIAMQNVSFRAPLGVYQRLSDAHLSKVTNDEMNICVGKEWYRFTSSFFLPSRRHKLRFVKEGFTGLLPRPYVEGVAGASTVRAGVFNDLNRATDGQFFEWGRDGHCDYYVDFEPWWKGAKGAVNDGAGRPMEDGEGEVVVRSKFLDSEASMAGWRSFYIPRFGRGLRFGAYVLVRRREGGEANT